MATYSGQNYGAGKPRRVLDGVKVSIGVLFAYSALMFVVL